MFANVLPIFILARIEKKKNKQTKKQKTPTTKVQLPLCIKVYDIVTDIEICEFNKHILKLCISRAKHYFFFK